MLRLLFLVSFLSWPVVASTDAGARDPLTASHESAFTDAQAISPLVATRAALAAEAMRCGLSDNRYAYNVALDKFAESERFILEKASEDGTAKGEDGGAVGEGRSAADCAGTVDRLRAADTALLARAELLPAR